MKVDGDCLHINGDCVKVAAARLRKPSTGRRCGSTWCGCSGQYTNRAQAERFLRAGARRGAVLAADGEQAGHRRHRLWGQPAGPQRPRNAGVQHFSCTTNCGVPLLKLLNEAIGLEYVSITTIHSAMNDQPVIDAYHHEDLRRTRSAFQS